MNAIFGEVVGYVEAATGGGIANPLEYQWAWGMTVTANSFGSLSGNTACDISQAGSLPTGWSGPTVELFIFLRALGGGANELRATARTLGFGSSVQAEWLIDSFSTAPFATVTLDAFGRFRSDATGVYAKIWVGGEPASWDFSDASTAAVLRFFFRIKSSNTTAYLDDLEVVEPCLGTCIDTFTRTVSGGWGTSEINLSGSPISWTTAGGTPSVNGSRGILGPGSSSGVGIAALLALPAGTPGSAVNTLDIPEPNPAAFVP